MWPIIQGEDLKAHVASRGFTLLELMISLTIVGLIAAIIFGALRVGVRAWEKGERDVESRQRERIVLDLLKRQLASVYLQPIISEGQQPFFLRGDSSSMEYVSQTPIVPSNEFGMVYVKYVVREEDGDDGERLTFFEKNISLIDKDTNLGELDEDAFLELFPAIENIEFEYMRWQTDQEPLEWEEEWDPEAEKGFPRAVRITFQVDDEKAPVYVIARIDV
ncbi:MAG: type II secretion system protein [Thermodesulfobacteriota bacterium]|nr:type II secretion system protein [Thermodesulfobacteriota bacterium]